MSWTDELISGIKEAILRDKDCRIAVHSEAQADCGRRAAARMAPGSSFTFVVIPEKEQEIYLAGMILV